MHDHQPVARIAIGVVEPAGQARGDLVIPFAAGWPPHEQPRAGIQRVLRRTIAKHVGIITPGPVADVDLEQPLVGFAA